MVTPIMLAWRRSHLRYSELVQCSVWAHPTSGIASRLLATVRNIIWLLLAVQWQRSNTFIRYQFKPHPWIMWPVWWLHGSRCTNGSCFSPPQEASLFSKLTVNLSQQRMGNIIATRYTEPLSPSMLASPRPRLSLTTLVSSHFLLRSVETIDGAVSKLVITHHGRSFQHRQHQRSAGHAVWQRVSIVNTPNPHCSSFFF